MTRIRRNDSYKSPYLPISKMSHMNAYGTDPVDAVNRVEPVPPMHNELTQVNKYMEIKEKLVPGKDKENSTTPDGKTQTVSELAFTRGSLYPSKELEKVTLNLGQYEQMRQDVERLKKLEAELSRIIQYFPALTGSEAEGTANYSIQINKEDLKTFMNQRIQRNPHHKGQINITHIDLK